MASPALAVEAFMLPGGADGAARLFALWHAPAEPARGAVLYVHPFAEELNKTRRMAALQARALAASGLGVLQIDLKGCGDSSGEFSDASWADWTADVRSAVRWLRLRSDVPLTLWGLRAGCLVLAEAAAQMPDETFDFLFWQASPSGAGVLRHFLRTAVATAFKDGGGKGVVEGLRQQLAAGHGVDVAGYRISPALARGLDQAQLLPPLRVGRLTWLEVSPGAGDGGGGGRVPLSPASIEASTPWRQRASHFELRVLSGPPFWQTAEIELAESLITATTAALSTAAAPASALRTAQPG